MKPYSEDDNVLIEVNLLHFLLDRRTEPENQFFRIVLLEHIRNDKITIGYNQLPMKEVESLAQILLNNEELRKCFYNLDKWCVEHRYKRRGNRVLVDDYFKVKARIFDKVGIMDINNE